MIDGVSANITVTVTPAPIASLTVAPQSVTLAVGGTIQFKATILATDGSEVTGVAITWSSSDVVVASVTTGGVVTGNAVGTVTITATGGGVSDAGTVFVVIQPVSALTITPATPSVFVGDSILLDANPVDGSGAPLTNRPVTWSTGDASVAAAVATGSVTQQAWLHGVAPGTTWVFAESGARKDSTLATVEPRANLIVSKISSASQVDAGETISFTLDVANDGPSPAAAVVLTDSLPGNATFVDATGNPSRSGNTLTWPAIASLAAGQSQSFTVRVIAPPSGAVTNVAAATAATAEADPVDNRAAVTVGVDALADLAVSKTASSAAVNAGAPIEYTITVRNIGLGTAQDVIVTDTLPGNADFVNASGQPSNAGGVLTWTVASMAPGEALQFTVQVTAPKQGAVTNVAAAETATGEVSASNNRAAVTTTVNPANLAVSKTGPAVVAPGAAATYTITVSNIGPGEAQDIIITDDLPAGTGFVSASGGGLESGGVVTWTLPSLASGASPAVFTVDITASPTGPMVNVASVQAATADSNTGNNSSSVTTAVALADLSVSKTGPAAVNAGEVITYTLNVSNDGPTAAAGTVLVDSLPAGTTFLTASVPPASAGAVLTWNLGDLASGGSTSIDVQVRTPATSASLSNVARAVSATADPDMSNNRSEVTTSVTAVANLGITKTGPAQANPGTNVTYTMDVVNAGPSTATDAVVTDALPAGAAFVSADKGGAEVGGVVTWPMRDIPNGLTVQYTVTLRAPSAAGQFTNTASVTSAVSDPVPANNTDGAQTVVTVADLSLSKSGPANATAAETITYDIIVTNAGPSAAANVVVTDTLPTDATFIDASAGGTLSGNVVTWTVQSIAASAQQTFTVRVLGPAAGGPLTNAAAVLSSTSDPQPGNNHETATTSVTPAANLGVTNVASVSSVSAGDTVVYSIEVTNLGPSDASAVILTDKLPQTGFVDATPSAGAPTGGVLTWPPFDLAAGSSVTFTVRVTAGAAGVVPNEAAVTSSTLDPDPSNNVEAVSTLVQTADLDLSISAPASVVVLTDMTYTVTVVNGGPGAAVGVTIESAIPVNTSYVGHSDGTFANGMVQLQVPFLAAGESASFDVTVNPGLLSVLSGVQMSARATSSSNDPTMNQRTASTTVTLFPPDPDATLASTSQIQATLAGGPDTSPDTRLRNDGQSKRAWQATTH
jgi:uncharacterized repeat protein (TIGR01451 family)